MTRVQALAGLICGVWLGATMLSLGGTNALLGSVAFSGACAVIFAITDWKRRSRRSIRRRRR